jgi:hypothetical protein
MILYNTELLKMEQASGNWWFMPVVLGTQETEIRRIMVQIQPGQRVLKALS